MELRETPESKETREMGERPVLRDLLGPWDPVDLLESVDVMDLQDPQVWIANVGVLLL